MTSTRLSNEGFTLIELLVVFTLLALLLSIAVPRYLGTAEQSRVKVREQNMATIRDALDKYRADQGRYPEKLLDLVEKKYLRSLPIDPVTESTEWAPIEDPTKAESGVSDVAPPKGTGGLSIDPTIDVAPLPSETPGSVPLPAAVSPLDGGAPMPMPMPMPSGRPAASP